MRLLLQLQGTEVVVCPAIGKVDDHARSRDLLGGPQAVHQNLTMQITLPNVSEGESKRVLHEQGTGGFHLLRDLLH